MAKGKYDLNFIDWENEFEYFAENAEEISKDPDHEYYDIYQIAMREFDELMEQELEEMAQVDEENGLTEEEIDKLKKGTHEKTGKFECSICYELMQRGDLVRQLPCRHVFHDQCILPWFKAHHGCPNCRYNIRDEKPA
eukprot:CAMPEP_0115008744 /NCGR_PEP_ID=MMETSP0216-20121206/22132_1 /TAXON_ID=223996 /ORGANISM="Protocruzia adherens, Strain Boccale" /LENGTH=137 /DNA_ID=CAMNT_0002376285 /DNA_START=45 /DNA_END=458 /DNA_ORIENTATION=-